MNRPAQDYVARLLEREPLTIAEIAERLHVCPERARVIVHELQSRGIVESFLSEKYKTRPAYCYTRRAAP